MRVWIKSHVTDRVLAPIREQLTELIEQEASLLDIGCGTGSLLFKSASKLSKGLGVDLDREMIDYAENKKRREGIDHLRFVCADARAAGDEPFDVATSTLCLHETGETVACEILAQMLTHSKKVLVADYCSAESMLARLGIELDEMLSGHYRRFRKYINNGAFPYYADKVGIDIKEEIKTDIDGISIWVMDGKGR